MIDLTPYERYCAKPSRDLTRGDVWQYSQQIAEVCLAAPIRTVLELGCHRGDSMRQWKESFNPSKIIGVELDDHPDTRAACEGLTVVWGDCNSEATFRQVVARLGSDKYRVDYLFIDADHTYEGMRRSFTMYSTLVRPGGIVILDDVCAPHHGTKDLAPEIAAVYDTKIISAGRARHVNGEGILVVRV